MFTTEQLVSILEQLDSYNDIMVFYRAQWKRIPTDILPLVHQALDDAEPPDTNNVSKHHFGVWATSETILSSWLVLGGGPRVVVSTAAFHARVRGSVPGLGGLKETKNVSSPSTCESQYCGEPP